MPSAGRPVLPSGMLQLFHSARPIPSWATEWRSQHYPAEIAEGFREQGANYLDWNLGRSLGQ